MTDKKAKVYNLDFTGVKERGQFNTRHKKPGDYLARLVAVEEAESKNGNNQLIFTCQLEGDKRASYPIYCGLEDKKQLWKIRALITAVGLATPSGRAKVNPNSMLNKVFGVVLEDDEYEGRLKSTVQDFFPKAEGGPYENEGATSSKAKSRVVEDDDDEDDDEDEDEPAPKKKAAAKKRQPEPEEDDEDEDDEEDDEEDEEPEPPKKKAKPAPAKKAAKKAPAKKRRERDEDEDDDDEMDI